MSDSNFIFKRITKNDLIEYGKSSRVYNMTLEEIKSDKIFLTEFHDEMLGDSVEDLTVAISKSYHGNSWTKLNIREKIDGYNEIPLGYLLDGISFKRVLIIIRRMSNMILDRKIGNSSTSIYSLMDDKYKNLSKDRVLIGKLAQYRIFVHGNLNTVKKHVRDSVSDQYDLDRILSGLDNNKVEN